MRRSSLKAVRKNGGQENLLTATERTVLYWSTLREADIAAISDGLIHLGALSKALRGRGAEADKARRDYYGVLDAYASGLSKLPDCTETVRRGLSIADEELEEFLADHAKGKIIRYDCFTHATLREWLPDEYSGNIELVIASIHGKCVGRWSAYPDEVEVAFQLGSAYRVDEHTVDGAGHIIELTEIVRSLHEYVQNSQKGCGPRRRLLG